jgi:hypothetical protein
MLAETETENKNNAVSRTRGKTAFASIHYQQRNKELTLLHDCTA